MSAINFSRDTKVYLEMGADIWEIPVLNGFSLAQATNTTEITISEASSATGVTRRGKKLFTDSIAPAEWSFSSYMRPNGGAFASLSSLGSVEEALWANFTSNNPVYDDATGHWTQGITKSVDNNSFINFTYSNFASISEFNLYVVVGGCDDADGNYTGTFGEIIYKVTDAVINAATIDFDIEGIATIQWSGFGGQITEEAAWDASGAITYGVGSSNNFIRNKLTDMTIVPSAGMQADHGFLAAYTAVLTGGSITIENNISYLTPETMCRINKPFAHVTGARTVTGNFTCYLDDTAGYSADLWTDIVDADTLVTGAFDVDLTIGGSLSPVKVLFDMPQVHFEVPTHSFDDIISLDVAFHALPTTDTSTDELSIIYTGVVPD